jgi:hypothetical protein
MLFGKVGRGTGLSPDEFPVVPTFWMLSARDSIQKLMVQRPQSKQPDKLCLSG